MILTFPRNGDERMHGNVTNEEWQIFKEAYQYFSDHCLPPANQDENAVDWWMSAAKDVGELDQKWKDYPMAQMLFPFFILHGSFLFGYYYINKICQKTDFCAGEQCRNNSAFDAVIVFSQSLVTATVMQNYPTLVHITDDVIRQVNIKLCVMASLY
jgi:hypothetical protein